MSFLSAELRQKILDYLPRYPSTAMPFSLLVRSRRTSRMKKPECPTPSTSQTIKQLL